MTREILIIEDNDQNLYLLTFILSNNGYKVSCAKDGETGINKAAEIKPSLILLDIQLPAMDGYTVAKRLRQIADLKHTPIVAVTSYAMPGDRERTIEAGCTGYIEKPINPDTFIRQVEAYLN